MKFFDWLKESNRLSHLKVGFAIWIVVMLIGCSMLSMFEEVTDFELMQAQAITITCSLLADLTVFISMCAVEYVQKSSGIGKFDWLDILAGMITPLIITIVIVIIYLL
jgi:hypothetical protein